MSELLGRRLKHLRDKNGLTQKFVADKIGVKNNTLSGYESGRREPDSEILRKLADFYDVSTDYLHGRTDNPKGFATEVKESTYYTFKSDPETEGFFKEYAESSEERRKELLQFWEIIKNRK